MSARLAIGISPCPNDTFAFHGLLSGAVLVAGCELTIELADVEELNQRLARGELDVAKASFAAALALSAEYLVLPVGAALGFGVGPLLLAAPGQAARRDAQGRLPAGARVLVPGEHTTAALLHRMFHPGEGVLAAVRFSEILPALAAGRADYGVCIHEGRFTFASYGVECCEDLGETWERATGAPLPLGGLLARRTLPCAVLETLVTAIRGSLELARARPEAALATMRAHAVELEDRVLWQHVELYVNGWTRDLGTEGRRALAIFAERARRAGLVAPGKPPLEVFAESAAAPEGA